MFIPVVFTTAKTWKQCKCPSKSKMVKKWYIYAIEYYSPIKKKEIMPFSAMWV